MKKLQSPTSLLELCTSRVARNYTQGVLSAFQDLQAFLPSPLVEDVIFFVEFSDYEHFLLYNKNSQFNHDNKLNTSQFNLLKRIEAVRPDFELHRILSIMYPHHWGCKPFQK
jgi:hypothetical protein